MTTAKELLDAGDLRSAIEVLTRQVRSNPSDVRQRTFLFELLCFAGDFDRAERQLDVIGQQSATAELGVQVYRNNIKAERDRGRLFTHGLHPHFLLEAPAYIDLHFAAINRVREGNMAEARSLLDKAEEDRPALAGKLNGKQFLDFRDYNDIVGPSLELIVQGSYTWLPFEQMRSIEIAAPKQLRDLMWAPAQIETINGAIGEVFIPALYAGSSDQPNDQVKLGRATEWNDLGGDLYAAAGLRLFLVDDADKALFEAKSIEFDAIALNSQASPW
jgi:type VI secretion system protein ImpE